MRKYSFLFLVTLSLSLLAEIPANYYQSVDGLTGQEILDSLHAIIDNHTVVDYSELEPYYARTDLDAQDIILDMYSLCSFTMSDANKGNSSVCAGWNKEHSVPQSYFKEQTPMKSDLFHVYPTDARVNNFRSNYPYGETASKEYIDGSKNALGHIGTSSLTGYSGKVYEPDDQYKGDFARTYFYMVARYLNVNFTQDSNGNGNGKVSFTYANSRAGLTAYAVSLFLKWHLEDPVSSKEIRRNEAVYAIQGNRNPFIDYPCLAQYIWGGNQQETLDMRTLMASSDADFATSDRSGCNCRTDLPTLLTPKNGSTVNVGAASVNEPVDQFIYVSGINLTQDLSLGLSGTNADMFSIHTTSISAANANQGTTLRVTYTPTATGQHTATLTIVCGDIATRTLTLKGSCTAELVMPATQTTYNFVAEGIHDTIRQVVHVKGTNLTSPVYLKVANDKDSVFAISRTGSVPAEEINEGLDLEITYHPKKLVASSALLIINSTGSEFAQPSLTLSGTGVFALRPVTDITSSSATLHWVDAGVDNYTVDVFLLSTEEEPEKEILNDTAGRNAQLVQYAAAEGKGEYMRLGSSKNGGSMTYSGLDFSNGAVVTITAKAYNSTDKPQMKVAIDTIDTLILLTTDDQDYSFSLPQGSPKSCAIMIASPGRNQRILIKNVKATTGGTKEVREHVNGYPVQVDATAHTVTDLDPETEYTYTVQPQGMLESDKETFFTNIYTGLPVPAATSVGSGYKTLDAAGRLLLHYNDHTYTAEGQLLY